MYHVAADTAKKFRVRVLTQLDAQLVSSDATASFMFETIKAGSDYAVTDYTYTNTLSGGALEAPNASIHSAIITDIDATGKAEFEVTFQCETTMTEPGGAGTGWSCPSPTGATALISNMSGLLRNNTYAPSAPTIEEADTAFTSGSASVVNITSANKVAGQQRFTVNVTQVTGPLYTNRDLTLFLKVTDPGVVGSASYKSFGMTIGAP
jgi:hypothetical protein